MVPPINLFSEQRDPYHPLPAGNQAGMGLNDSPVGIRFVEDFRINSGTGGFNAPFCKGAGVGRSGPGWGRGRSEASSKASSSTDFPFLILGKHGPLQFHPVTPVARLYLKNAEQASRPSPHPRPSQ